VPRTYFHSNESNEGGRAVTSVVRVNLVFSTMKNLFVHLLCASHSCIRSGVCVWFLHLQRGPTVSLGFPAASRGSVSAFHLRFSPTVSSQCSGTVHVSR
jgi:hypothetical protein